MPTTTQSKTAQNSRTTHVSKLTPAKLQGWARGNRQAVLDMIAARIRAASERARVDAYIEPLFQALGLKDEEGKLIALSKNIYRCEDEAASSAFFAACEVAHREHGFTGPADYCPALIAENAMIKAENVVLKAAEKLVGGPVYHLEDRAKLLGIITSMIASLTS